MNIYASPDGTDAGDGGPNSPWPLQKAFDALRAEEHHTLLLYGGSYVGFFTVSGVSGSGPDNPKFIRSVDGERAIIDGTVGEFRDAPNEDWEKSPIPNSDEYISVGEFPASDGIGGSFLNRSPHTRLITHQFLDDLRSDNERFGVLCEGSLIDGPPPRAGFPARPWIYMGPGLNHIDPGEQPALARIHVRLSPTHNDVAGFPDYDGESDPRKVRLAIWVTTLPTLAINNCDWLCLSDLIIRHGNKTLVMRDSVGIQLDHIDVAAGTSGIMLRGTCDLTTISHCTVDGGLPPWYFRSDRKDGFHLPSDIDDKHPHAPGERTLDTLLGGPGTISNTTVKHCEFVNGHDMFTFGDQMTFSRNWIKNLDDDALVIDTKLSNVRIFENVVEQCATTISSGSKADSAGGTHIYRNLLDLRRPIARTRPRIYQQTDCDPGGKDRQTLTTAYLYKSTPPDGPLFFFQNTCIVKDVELAASFNLFRSAHIDAPRQAFNNIFVSVNSVVRSDKPIAYIPPPRPGLATDGNCFYRTGQYTAGPLIGHPEDHTHAAIDTLRELRGFPTVNDPGEPGDPPVAPNHYFTDSQAVYEPGFEESSIEGDPLFRRFRPLHSGASGVDDFRLRTESPTRGAGVELVGEMAMLDTALHSDHPDMGFLPFGSLPLAVGVEGRRLFPKPGPTLPGTGATHTPPDQPAVLM